MSNYSPSNNEQDNEFMQSLAQYEEMKTKNATGYFDSDQLADFAEFYATSQQYDDAFEVIDYALSIHPGNTEILVIKAHIFIDLKEIEKAKEIAFSISERYDRDVKLLKAEIFLLEGKIEKADALLQGMSNQDEDDDSDFFEDAAYLYMDSELPEKAMPWFEKALKLDPDNSEVRVNLADCYSQCNQLDKAIDLYNKLLDEDPYSTEYWYESGKLYFSIDKFDKALEAYDFVLTIDKEHLGAILMSAHCYFKLENYEKSCEFYQKYEQLDPESGMSVFFIGLCYFNLKQYDNCIQELKKALKSTQELAPEKTDVYSYLSSCYDKLGSLEEAIHYIDLAIEEDKLSANLYLSKGRIYLNHKKPEEAAKCFEEALKLNPEDPETYAEMGAIYFENEEYELALNCYKKVDFYSPGYESCYISMAYISAAMGHLEDFKFYFNKAAKQDPGNFLNEQNDLLGESKDLNQLILDMENKIEKDGKIDIHKSDFN